VYPSTPPPKPRTAPWKIILPIVLGVLSLLACIGLLGSCVAAVDDAAKGPDALTAPAGTAPGDTGRAEGETVPTLAPAERVFTAKDFEPTLKIKSKDCIDFSTIPDSCTYSYEVRLGISDRRGPDSVRRAPRRS
jgi:hypothetical protein